MRIFLASDLHAPKIDFTPFLLYDRIARIPGCGSADPAGRQAANREEINEFQ